MVKPHRFDHCVRVSILAEAIARANRFNPSEIRATSLAGMLHDAARDLTAREMFELSPPQSELEEKHFLTLHGRAGKSLVQRWGIHDERVLEAIEGHVFGVSHTNRIGMAVYIADVSEPARGVNEDIRELAMRNLFRAYQYALDSKVRYLRAKGKVVHPITLRVYEEICEPVL
jgi:predicted HD superfamily hydrolase involved in NAD metabolism